MFRPSLNPSVHRREVVRNLTLDLTGAAGAGISLALVVSLLPTIARRGGLVTSVTENAVNIKETVQDASGDWVERLSKLELQESQGTKK